MDYELKRLIDQYTNLIATATAGSVVEMSESDMRDAVKFELASFAMYLSCSDGEITWEEAQYISDMLDLNLTSQSVKELVDDMNIYSIEYETTAPASLQTAVLMDNTFYENGQDIDGASTCNVTLALYQAIAKEIMSVDGFESFSETRDCETYLGMMRAYIAENRLTDQSAPIPKKVTVKVGQKAGVKAPEKK